MPEFVIETPPTPCLPVADGEFFPIRRIFCVGRNYAAHAREMGANPEREPPFFFTKPADAAVAASSIPYPPATANLHHEVELVVALGDGGADIAAERVEALIYGYAVGVDLTRRDLQDEAKSLRRPWDMSKGFDASAPTGALAPASRIGHPARGRIALSVNGVTRQDGDLADMIWDTKHIIADLSRLVALAPGDLIFTGTPEGVGAVSRGDKVHAEIAGVGTLDFKLS